MQIWPTSFPFQNGAVFSFVFAVGRSFFAMARRHFIVVSPPGSRPFGRSPSTSRSFTTDSVYRSSWGIYLRQPTSAGTMNSGWQHNQFGVHYCRPTPLHEGADAERRVGCCGRCQSIAAHRGDKENLGLHQEEQSTGRSQQADDQCGWETEGSFRQGQVSMFEMTKIISQHLK